MFLKVLSVMQRGTSRRLSHQILLNLQQLSLSMIEITLNYSILKISSSIHIIMDLQTGVEQQVGSARVEPIFWLDYGTIE